MGESHERESEVKYPSDQVIRDIADLFARYERAQQRIDKQLIETFEARVARCERAIILMCKNEIAEKRTDTHC